MTFEKYFGFTFADFMLSDPHIMSTEILNRFCIAGINYHVADTKVRGAFSVNKDVFHLIAAKAKEQNLRSVFVLSTCNRTEIYGFAESVIHLVRLLTEYTKGSQDEFLEHAYLKSGNEAVEHLYDVASGIDSQILGDYEILGQLKLAISEAEKMGMIGPIMNRTINFAIQASKRVKTETALSSGTVSVSYAAIELLKDIPGIAGKKVLVVGAGKFGSNVCKNLVNYIPGIQVTITNRTAENARQLAETAGIQYVDYDLLPATLNNSDVVIVCTNASQPTIVKEYFTGTDQKMVLDLSVPMNVHTGVRTLSNVHVIDVDEISTTILDKTFSKRKGEVPKAKAILQQYKVDFYNWLNDYRYSLHIKNWKDKLQELAELHPGFCEMATDNTLLNDDRKVQKAVSRLAVNLRTNQEKGCQFINAINDYLQMS